MPFFSRRIGLADGRPVPVVGGLRLTGRVGAQNVGILNLHTASFSTKPADSFTAIVVKRPVSTTTAVGGFYFGRESDGPDSHNRVAGFDFRFTPRRTFDLEAIAMRSLTADQPGDWAARTGFQLATARHRTRVGFFHIGGQFRNDLGFVPRRGIGTMFSTYSHVFRSTNSRARVLEHTLGADFELTGDDRYSRVLTRISTLTYGTIFADGGLLSAALSSTSEYLDAPFSIGSNVRVPPGQYRFEGLDVTYASNKSATISGGIGLQAGEFWTGQQRALNGSVRFRVNAHFAASATIGRTVIDLPQGFFTADLLGLRIDASITPRMFLNTFIQYNGETDAWLSNIRFNLIHRPLSDIYVVWNETRLPNGIQRALLLKFTQLLAF
jgi:hypothetical protein